MSNKEDYDIFYIKKNCSIQLFIKDHVLNPPANKKSSMGEDNKNIDFTDRSYYYNKTSTQTEVGMNYPLASMDAIQKLLRGKIPSISFQNTPQRPPNSKNVLPKIQLFTPSIQKLVKVERKSIEIGNEDNSSDKNLLFSNKDPKCNKQRKADEKNLKNVFDEKAQKETFIDKKIALRGSGKRRLEDALESQLKKKRNVQSDLKTNQNLLEQNSEPSKINAHNAIAPITQEKQIHDRTEVNSFIRDIDETKFQVNGMQILKKFRKESPYRTYTSFLYGTTPRGRSGGRPASNHNKGETYNHNGFDWGRKRSMEMESSRHKRRHRCSSENFHFTSRRSRSSSAKRSFKIRKGNYSKSFNRPQKQKHQQVRRERTRERPHYKYKR